MKEAIETARKDITEGNIKEIAFEMSKRYGVLSDKFFDDEATKEEIEEMDNMQKVWTVVIKGDFNKNCWEIGSFENLVNKNKI